MDGFAVNYILANAACVIVFGILVLHNHFSLDRQESQVKFGRALVAFALYFLTDCFWAAVMEDPTPEKRTGMVIIVFLLYLFVVAITYFWLEYVQALEQVAHRNRPVNRFAVLFPFIVSTIALIVQYIVAPGSLLNDSLDTGPSFSIYLTIVPGIYIVAILFYTIRRAVREENPSERRRHLFIGIMPLLILFCGVVQSGFFPDLPIFCLASMILMLVFYIRSIESLISIDPLTGLNNRGQLMRYTSQKTNLYLDDRRTIVAMSDIDEFKSINDTHGHAEGDHALVVVADVLKRVAGRHEMPSFLGRYGGDEFVLILHPKREKDPDELIRTIRSEIEEEIGTEDVPYPLALSLGYDELEEGEDGIQSCFARADESLYREKTKRKNRSLS